MSAATTTPRTARRPWFIGRGQASLVAPLAVVVLGASMLFAAPPAAAAQPPVELRTADAFAVLAGSGITNTGPTTITGDVGTFPTPSETGFETVTLIGTNQAGNAVTRVAKDDLVTAYDDAARRTPETNLAVELGGSTLLAGVYTSPTFGLTGTLTLDAAGVPAARFIFKAGSTLITASNSRVLLINGADPCNVVWQVGSSATFGTGTSFVGDVLALTSITAGTGATFRGRLLARDGAVTLDTNTITKAACAAPPTTTTTTTGATTTTTAPTPVTVAPTTTTTVPADTPTTSAPGLAASPDASAAGTPTADSPGPSATAGPTPSGGPEASPPATTPSVAGGPPATTSSIPTRQTGRSTTTSTVPVVPFSPRAGPGSPDGPPGVALAPPATGGAPPREVPVAPSSPSSPSRPSLPVTGGSILGLSGVGLGLLALGAGALTARRRGRMAPTAT